MICATFYSVIAIYADYFVWVATEYSVKHVMEKSCKHWHALTDFIWHTNGHPQRAEDD